MKPDRRFSCYIIGRGSLPIQCAEILLRAGHEILGIISADEAITRWAVSKAIACHKPGIDLLSVLSRTPFDYLFSIVNEHILNDEILALPRKLTINFHDAPLPKYAGPHPTSWALLNQEKSHGISWLLSSKEVDAGDILEQRSIKIHNEETAFTLNTKCYEAAIQSFAELVDELSTGRAKATKQNLGERSFFPRHIRPPAGCLISWNRSADEIAALVRALDFGPHPNPLGVAKFAVESNFIIPREVRILGSASGKPPGTVTTIGGDHLVVSTATRDIALRGLSTLDGRPLQTEELKAPHRLTQGVMLNPLEEPKTRAIGTIYEACSQHEAFWVEKLTTLQPLALPYAVPNVPRESASSTMRHSMSLPPDVLDSLANCRGMENVGEVVMAAWAAYLCRIGGTNCFDLGFSDSSLRRDLADLGNFFALHLPLRIQIDDEHAFASFLSGLQSSLSEIKRRLTFPRDVAVRYPVLRSAADAEFSLPVAAELANEFDAEDASRTADLTLSVLKDGTRCVWVYDPNRFATGNVEQMARQFSAFLEGLAAEPERSIARLPLMPDTELQQILVQWNDTAVEYPRHLCIHQVFEAQAARKPDHPAVACLDAQLTYAELNARANQLARHLQTLGVGPETLVGLCVRRGVEMAVGVLGILKAGGAWLPLDPAYPQDRLAFMLENARVSVLVTDSQLAEALPGHTASIVALDRDSALLARLDTGNLKCAATPENLAYVIYTSGSTGQPKGVMILHRNLVNYVQALSVPLGLKADERYLHTASISFSSSVRQLLLPLSLGATVVVATADLIRAPLALFEEVKRRGVTVIDIVPSYWRGCTQALAGLEAGARAALLDNQLRLILSASEPLPSELPHRWKTAFKFGARLVNMFGQTETTGIVTLYPISDTANQPKIVRIGKPISNAKLYLLDQRLQPVPVGVLGELHIGGAGVGRGYLHLPKLTEEKFIPDPFSRDPAARLYKTGDRARYLPDGTVEFAGRGDGQLKIRGFRIEPGEIESVLGRYPGVKECVVLAREDDPGNKRLVAYIVSDAKPGVAIKELYGFLKAKVPDYMVPAAFVKLDALPSTPNGKLDRPALPKPDPTQSEMRETFVPARDAVEQKLVSIWEELLGLQKIGIKDNFFYLGGDSLQAVRLFAQIEEVFHKKLSLATLLEAPAIEQLAAIIRSRQPAKAWSALVAIQPAGPKPPLYCMHAAGGNVLFYRDLARHLGPDQPVYGLQAREMPETGTYLDRVEDMAAQYLSEIFGLQPQGPYYLCGSSFGGLVAYEMAQQLRAQRQEIALLALFDTYGPGYPQPLPGANRPNGSLSLLANRLKNLKGQLAQMEAGARWEFIQGKAKKAVTKIRRNWLYKRNQFQIQYEQALGGELPKDLQRNHKAIQLASDNYHPRPCQCRLTIFRAAIQPKRIVPDPSLGWQALATQGIEVIESPGMHGAMTVDPYAKDLAQHLLVIFEKNAPEGMSHSPELHSGGFLGSQPTCVNVHLAEH